MNIRFLSWEANGLRCPDMKVDFDSTKKIHFVQMPNATGKTTIINLIKHTLSNNWKNVDINEFEDSQRNIKEGEFKLSIQTEINNKKNILVFKVSFDFRDGSYYVKTTSGATGERSGFKPTEEIEAFLTNKHIRTFIFEGDNLGSYFHQNQDIAIDTIDTFSGISKIDDLQVNLNDTFAEMKRGTIGNTVDKLQKEVDDLKQKKEKLEQAINRGNEEREKIFPKFDSLNTELEQRENKEKIRNNDLEILDEDIQEIKDKINALETTISNQLKNPYNISDGLRHRGKTFLDQLEKQKLPGYAKEFLYELAEADDCICGDKITATKKQNILQNSNKYLGGDDANIVNRIKSENIDYILDSEAESVLMNQNFNDLKSLNDEFYKINKKRKKLAIEVAKSSGLFDKIKKRDKFKKQIDTIDEQILVLKKIDSETLPDVKKKDYKQIKSIFGINNKLIQVEEKLAKKQGYENEKNSLEKFISCLRDAAEDSRETIIDEIKTSLNKKIRSTHSDNTFEIEKIDKCLNVKHQKGGGSGAQKVIAVTAFALSVLERSGVSFPLVIDHPVTAIEDESRNEFSKMIVEVCHQAIHFVITGEKADFIVEKQSGQMHNFLENISTTHTIFRTDRDIKPQNIPDNIEHQSDNAIITTDRDYFINFSRN